MTSWLRQHRYALDITLRRLALQPFSSLANLIVMALALALPLLGSAILVSVQPLAREVSVTPELTVFLRMDAPAGAAAQVAERIRREYADQVSPVRVVERDRALAELRRDPAWEQALAVLPENPLPDAVVATLASGPDLAGRAAELAAAWRQWQDVDQVLLDSAWVQRLEALLRFGRIGLGLLAAAVALVVLATVFNTVRMQALSQREEIAVARLVGATESFVRRPFLRILRAPAIPVSWGAQRWPSRHGGDRHRRRGAAALEPGAGGAGTQLRHRLRAAPARRGGAGAVGAGRCRAGGVVGAVVGHPQYPLLTRFCAANGG